MAKGLQRHTERARHCDDNLQMQIMDMWSEPMKWRCRICLTPVEYEPQAHRVTRKTFWGMDIRMAALKIKSPFDADAQDAAPAFPECASWPKGADKEAACRW
jgi:hypothetical protein